MDNGRLRASDTYEFKLYDMDDDDPYFHDRPWDTGSSSWMLPVDFQSVEYVGYSPDSGWHLRTRGYARREFGVRRPGPKILRRGKSDDTLDAERLAARGCEAGTIEMQNSHRTFDGYSSTKRKLYRSTKGSELSQPVARNAIKAV
jgi:hypothetical protein